MGRSNTQDKHLVEWYSEMMRQLKANKVMTREAIQGIKVSTGNSKSPHGIGHPLYTALMHKLLDKGIVTGRRLGKNRVVFHLHREGWLTEEEIDEVIARSNSSRGKEPRIREIVPSSLFEDEQKDEEMNAEAEQDCEIEKALELLKANGYLIYKPL